MTRIINKKQITNSQILEARKYFEKFKKQKEALKRYDHSKIIFDKRKLNLINRALGEFYVKELTK